MQFGLTEVSVADIETKMAAGIKYEIMRAQTVSAWTARNAESPVSSNNKLLDFTKEVFLLFTLPAPGENYPGRFLTFNKLIPVYSSESVRKGRKSVETF